MHSPEGVVLLSVREMPGTECRVLMLKVLLVLGSSRQPKRFASFALAAVEYYAALKVLVVFALAAAQASAAPVRDYSLEVSLPLPVAWQLCLSQYVMRLGRILMVEQLRADLL